METTTRLILPEVIDALETSPEALVELTEELHPADLADVAAALSPEQAHKMLAVLPTEIGARMLEHLQETRRSQLFASLATQAIEKATALTDEMAADERADLYAELGEELRTELLDAMDEQESRDIRQLLSYTEGTAGALMTTDFVVLPASVTAQRSIEIIREGAADKETIYQAYAIDDNGTLLGVVSLRDLVVSPATRKVAEIMNPNMVSVSADTDQTDVVRMIAKYDLLALPVVNRHHHLVGIITVDDAIDVVEEETTKDVQKMGGMEALEQPYLQAAFGSMLRKRAGWLSALFLGELLTATAMAYFDKEIAHAVVLAVFLPLIISSGGNSGSQATTLVIRALALGEIGLRDFWRVMRRELGAGVSLGLILGIIGLIRIIVWHAAFDAYGPHFVLIGLTVGVSVVGVVLWGTLAGAALPFLLHRVGFDPASASAPLVATLVDVSGLIIYFSAASIFLTGTLL